MSCILSEPNVLVEPVLDGGFSSYMLGVRRRLLDKMV